MKSRKIPSRSEANAIIVASVDFNVRFGAIMHKIREIFPFCKITYAEGNRMMKVYKDGEKKALFFVDKNNGDIYWPSNFEKPRIVIVGNIYNDPVFKQDDSVKLQYELKDISS